MVRPRTFDCTVESLRAYSFDSSFSAPSQGKVSHLCMYVCMYVCIVCMYYIYMFHGNIGFFLGKHLKRGLMETKKFDIFDCTP